MHDQHPDVRAPADRCLVATAGASDLAVFLSVAGDVAPSFKEHIRFAIRLYNPAAPVKTIERGATASA